MPRMLSKRRGPVGLPRVARGRLIHDGCVRANVLHDSDVVQVVHWACEHDGDALRAERWHTHHVVSLLHTGACSIRQGSWEQTLDATTALVHRPGATYTTGHPFGVCDRGWSLAFRSEVAEDVFDRSRAGRTPWARPSRLRPTECIPDYVEKFVLLWRLREGDEVDGLAADEMALDVLAALLRHDEPDPALSVAQRKIAHRARSIVRDAPQNAVALKELAALAGTSPYHLCRVFRKEFGVSVGRYRRRLQLMQILERLSNTTESLTEIALTCGFSSHSHMTTAFVQEFGRPPRDVRQAIANDASLEASDGEEG